MTGYGLADLENDRYSVHVEVKTLNSKFLDLALKLPRQFGDKEHEVRNIVADRLVRGKVSMVVEISEKQFAELPVSVNRELFNAYVREYRGLAKEAGLPSDDLFRIILQSPNVVTVQADRSDAVVPWSSVLEVIERALTHCDVHRQAEGDALLGKFKENLRHLKDGLQHIRAEEPGRKQRTKDKIRNHFSEWLDENDFDRNRFEQELIYYFEKLDITEEIVRLETHLNYFEKVMVSEPGQGKKLGFIGQEIGREINTIGSKANDAVIQQTVIQMKDELEKIKEQVLNII